VWRDPLDPLARPARPTGTGSGAYVEQPEPRANPMTIEGEIAAIGEMARGTARATGRLGRVGRLVIGLALLGFGVSLVFSVVNMFRG
jgi:hypothetical protein